MLSRADADLARRDADLPGLATLLDPEAFLAAVNLSKATPQIDSARISYVRYKPGRSCLVGYQLGPGASSEYVSATALRTDARDKLGNALARPGRILIANRAIVVAFFPIDDRLPALARLGDAESRRRLLSKLMPNHAEWIGGTIETLRYKPERRLVARLVHEREPRAILKFYASESYSVARANARAFRSRPGCACAEPLGKSDRRRTIAVKWLPGQSLTDALKEPAFQPQSVAAAGAALAELHSQVVKGLTRRTRAEEAVALAPVAKWLSFVCPPIAEQATSIARRLAVNLEQLPPEKTPLHGDFYAAQLLLNGSNIGVIDFDEAYHGDPAADLGTFQAHLEGNALRGNCRPDLVAPVMEALLSGYQSAAAKGVSLGRVALYAAVGLLRLAAHPFRNREPLWTEHTVALLDRADELLGRALTRTSKIAVRVLR